MEQLMHKRNNESYNFRGFMIGNGYTSSKLAQLIYDQMQQLHVISYDLWLSIRRAGCIYIYYLEDIPKPKNPPECDVYWNEMLEIFKTANVFDLYRHNYNQIPLPNSAKKEG